MPPVKTHAWAKEFLGERAAAGGNELAGVAGLFFFCVAGSLGIFCF